MQCSREDHNKKLGMYFKRSWFSKFNPPSSSYDILYLKHGYCRVKEDIVMII